MICTNCGKEMIPSAVESTLMRNVLRCPQCGYRSTHVSTAGWLIRGGLFLLSSTIGAPIDFGGF